ncbi:MAG: hypothetical protein JOZ16_14020 [Methylobacteriaceae bacterium]|nr:hypothetical protein [Methylobacteriaceae bacterium]
MRVVLVLLGIVFSTAASVILVWAAAGAPDSGNRPQATAALSEPELPDATLLSLLAEGTGGSVVAMDRTASVAPGAKKPAAKRAQVADKNRCATATACSNSHKRRGAESPPPDEYPGGLTSFLNAAQRDLQQLAQNLRSGGPGEPGLAR